MSKKPARRTPASGKKYSILKTSPIRERLDILLRRELGKLLKIEVSNTLIRKMIFARNIKVNGKSSYTPDHSIKRGDRIDIFVPATETDRSKQEKQNKNIDFVILYEDNCLIAVEKPSGIPTHPTIDKSRTNLFDLVRQMLAKRDKLPEPYLAIHHRLDRDTSGIVVFVKDQKLNQAIGEIFSERKIEKIYIAKSHLNGTEPQKNWTVENHLGPIGKIHGKTTYGPVKSGGQLAITEFTLLNATSEFALIEAHPITGRTHQIRSHLLSSGLPIMGDELYFNQKNRDSNAKPTRLLLHAHRLTFCHPVTKSNLVIESKLPF